MNIRRLSLLVIFLTPLVALSAQNCGSRDTVLTQVNGTTDYVLNIDDLVNGDLAALDQGLCGVELSFSHQYVYDVVATLTSPAGQSVTLIGPNNNQNRPPTIFARWFIDFTGCAQPTDPDPGAPAVWNNNHPFNWAIGGVYTGTYQPNNGCLEDFNVGPANGNWTLNVQSNQPGAGGGVIFFRLVFCDDTGFDCCFADAGAITAGALTRCITHPDLQLDLPPTYNQPRPDTSEYDYAYVIAQSGNYFALDSTLDLTTYPAGDYEICGFSYRRGELGNLPPDDGSVSLQEFRDDLASLTPSICGDLSTNCYQVEILPLVDTTFITTSICTGDDVTVGSNVYNTTGLYVNDLVGQGFCDSVVVLDLTVVDRLETFIDTTICFGETLAVGNSIYDQAGNYSDTLVSSFGCDSVVYTSLAIRPENTATLLVSICIGDTFFVAGEPFFSPIITDRTVVDVNGCDSTIFLDLAVLAPQIDLGTVPVLNCYSDQVTVDASASVTQYATVFRWFDSNNLLVGSGPTLTLDTFGVYYIEIQESFRGVSCTVRDTLEILDLRALPSLDAGPEDTLTCNQVEVQLGGNGTSTGTDFTYNWTGPPGAGFLDPTNAPITLTNTPGDYQLLVVNVATGCRDSLTATIVQDTVRPSAAIQGGGGILNCATTSLLLTADSLQANNLELAFRWTSACLPAPISGPSLSVDCPGNYTLTVTNTRTGCSSSSVATITQNIVPPVANILPPIILTCDNPVATLDGRGSSPAANLQYRWRLNGGPVLGSLDTLDVSLAGTYSLVVTDVINFCTDSTTVTVLADQVFPTADAGPDTTALTCYTPTQIIGGPGSSQGPDFVYTWTMVGLPNDTLGQDPNLTINAPAGFFELSVRDRVNGCTTFDSSRVLLQIDTPFVRIAEPLEFGCFAETVAIDASATFLGFTADLQWTGGPCLPDDLDSPTIFVECPGTYSLTVVNLDNGCVGDSTVTVDLAPNSVVAVLPDSAFIDCVTGLATIIDQNSTPAVNKDWFLDGNPVSLVGQNPVVNVPGTYTLVVANFDLSCSDTATIEVVADCPLLSIIAPPDSLTCNNTQVLLDATTSIPTDPAASSIEWLIPVAACAVPGATDRQILVACPGTYGFVVTDLLTGDADTALVTVTQDLIQPIANAGPNDVLTCNQPVVTLTNVNSQQDPRFEYIWTNSSGDTINIGPTANVNTQGIYFLRVRNTETGCSATDVVAVTRNVNTPDLSFSGAFIPCQEDSFALTVITDPLVGNYDFSWSGPLVVAQSDSSTVLLGQEGTYTATVTNLANGCATAEDIFVEQLPCPPCLILNDTAFTCLSDDILLAADFCEACVGCTFQWSRNGVSIPGATASQLTINQPGNYRLSAVNVFGLSSAVTITVSDLRVLPQAAAGPDRFLTCDSSSVNLGRAIVDTIFGFTYQWFDPSGAAIPGATTNFLNVNQPGIYGLQSSNGVSFCSEVDTVIVAYDTLAPVADAGNPVELTCDDPLNVLNGQGTTTGSAIDYVWSGGPSITCLEGRNTLSPIVSCGGTYELWVRDNRNGCISTDTVVVTASDALPQIIPLADTFLSCAVDSISLTPFLQDPTFVSSWCGVDALGDTIPGSCETGLVFGTTVPGDYLYTVTNTATGCSNGFALTITEDYRLPTVSTGLSDTFFCTLDSLALTGSGSTQSGSPPQFIWTSQTGFTVGAAASDTAYAFQPDRYYLEVTDPLNGCTAVDSIDFFQDITAPNAFAGQDTSLNCQRRQLRLQGVGSTFSGQVQYAWTTLDGNIAADPNGLTPLVNRAGNYLFSVTDPVNSCTTQDIVAVVEDTIVPQALFTPATSLLINCYQPITSLDATASTGEHPITYAWRTQGVGTPLNGITTPQVQVDAAGSYQLVVRDVVNTCRDTLSVSVNSDFVQPTVSILPPARITCDTLAVTVTGVAPNDNGNYRYAWQNAATNDTLGNSIQQLIDQAGTYRLGVQDTLNGCIREVSVTVNADQQLPTIVLDAPGELNCEQAFILLNAEGSSNGPGFVLNWSTNNGQLGARPNPLRIRALEAGTYFLNIEDLDNGCELTDSIVIDRDARFIDVLELETMDPACTGQVSGTVMVVGVEGGTPPYRFRVDGGLLTDRMVYEDLPIGTYDFTVIDSSGCERTETFTISEGEQPQLSLGPDQTINQGDSIALDFTTNRLIWDTLIWTSQGPLPRPGVLPAYVSPTEGVSYELTLVDTNGCRVSDNIRIEVLNDIKLYVPNTFSPNGDNNNDLFFPYGGPQISQVNRFLIFDRWGNMVHEASNFQPGDPLAGWDGTFEGKPLNTNVFVWRLELELADGMVVSRYGDVLLMR